MKILPIILLILILSAKGFGQDGILKKRCKVSNTLPLNTTYSEIGPYLIDGTLFFAGIAPEHYDKKQEQQFYDLFSIPADSSHSISQPRERVMVMNTQYHDGPIAYCPATGELFITRSNAMNAIQSGGLVKKTQVQLSLHIYQKIGTNWVFKAHFPYNNPNYSVCQAAINPTGDTLVFVSDMPGGMGATDLWYCTRSNGQWQSPQNMGEYINSNKHEITPFINPYHQLVFASNRPGGNGGYDLYQCPLAPSKNQKPWAMLSPVNSKHDDFGLCIANDQLSGYMVSNRNHKNDDIFQIRIRGYEEGMEQLKKAEGEIKKLEQLLNEQLDNFARQKSENDFITSNVQYKIQTEIIKNVQPDLKITYTYRLGNTNLWPGHSVYQTNKYLSSQSNPVAVLLNILERQLSTSLTPYINEYTHLEINITGNADTDEMYEKIPYQGEFGEKIVDNYLINDSIVPTTIVKDSLIGSNELAFLRAYGIQHHIKQNLNMLKDHPIQFGYSITPFEQLQIENDWFTLEIMIGNALGMFGN